MANTDKTNRQEQDLETRRLAHERLNGAISGQIAGVLPDPTGDDPFTPGAPEVPGGVKPERLDERERKAVQMANHDPNGEDGPSYEVHQGDADPSHGGSTDPNNDLEHEDSGIVENED